MVWQNKLFTTANYIYKKTKVFASQKMHYSAKNNLFGQEKGKGGRKCGIGLVFLSCKAIHHWGGGYIAPEEKTENINILLG